MVAPYSGAMLPMVARSGSARGARAFAEEFDKLAHHLVLAQDLRHGEHQVGGGHAFAQLAGQLKAHHIGREEYTGWPSMAASASMPPTPQPTTPMPLIMVVWLSVPTRCRGSRRRFRRSPGALVHAARQIFEVDLVHDAKARRHHTKGVKGLHAPFHELVALAVALESELHVQVQRILLP